MTKLRARFTGVVAQVEDEVEVWQSKERCRAVVQDAAEEMQKRSNSQIEGLTWLIFV